MIDLDGERIAAWVLGLLLVVATLAIGYLGTPFTATHEEIEAATANTDVQVSTVGEGYVLSPKDSGADRAQTAGSTALVFYPGARVHPDAYVPVLVPVVDQTGMTVFVPKPRLYLAVFEQNMAEQVIDAHPEVERWLVGGHSLGGAMACRFAHRNPDRVDGLVLFGSYCDRDLDGSAIRVLAVNGGADTVLDPEAYQQNRDNLPDNRTTEISIEGMNHTQFGVYSGQRGDSPASISHEEAHERIQATLISFVTDRRENIST